MEQQRFECEIDNCHKTYSNSFNLKRHVESFHKGLKKFFCSLCNKGLSSRQNLREHKFIHLGVKPYKCTLKNCQSAFRQASQLSLHEKMHIEIYKNVNPKTSIFTKDISFFTTILSKVTDYQYIQIEETQNEAQKIVLPQIKFENPLL